MAPAAIEVIVKGIRAVGIAVPFGSLDRVRRQVDDGNGRMGQHVCDCGGHGLAQHLRNVRARLRGRVDGGAAGRTGRSRRDLAVGDSGPGRGVVGQDGDVKAPGWPRSRPRARPLVAAGGPLTARGRHGAPRGDDDQANMRTRRNCAVTITPTASRTTEVARRPTPVGALGNGLRVV